MATGRFLEPRLRVRAELSAKLSKTPGSPATRLLPLHQSHRSRGRTASCSSSQSAYLAQVNIILGIKRPARLEREEPQSQPISGQRQGGVPNPHWRSAWKGGGLLIPRPGLFPCHSILRSASIYQAPTVCQDWDWHFFIIISLRLPKQPRHRRCPSHC